MKVVDSLQRGSATPLASVIAHPATAWVILFLSFVLTGVAWYIADSAVKKRAVDRFAFQTQDVTKAITKRMQDYEGALRAGVGLFNASQVVSRAEWHTFAKHLQLQAMFPGIQGFGFSRMVPPQEKEGLINSIRAEGFSDFTLRPAGEREMYSAIVFLEPFDWRNQRAFGYDMYSEPVRRAAMERARDSGQPALSGRVTLVQETEKDVQQGVLMYIPVYRQDRPITSVEERRAALFGFVYAPFRMNDLMRHVLGAEQGNIDFELYDGEVLAEEHLLYNNASVASPQHSKAGKLAGFSRNIMLNIAGRVWTLHLYARSDYISSAEGSQPAIVAVGGVLVDLLLFLIIGAIGRQKLLAEQVAKAKGEFLANMSHEIRTPLNAVLGLARIGARDTHETASRDNFTRILDSGAHLLGIVNDILDCAKIDAGKFSIQESPFQPTAVLANAHSFLDGLAQQKGLQCQIDFRGLPKWLLGDAQRLQQILVNLLSNAVKFTDQGQVQLSASWSDGEARFCITDSGIGMTPEQMERLFTPFEQADNSSTRRFGGTGLGLTISQRLAQLMGGTISVESRLGQGSTFTLTLPLPETAAPVPTEPQQRPMPVNRPLAGLHLLAAEDDAVNRLILEDVLQEAGATFEMVENGQQAVERVQAQPSAFVVVLMDVQMPVLDGLEATRRIKTIAPGLPVIGLTAHALAEEHAKCLQAGMVHQVSKPYQPHEIIAEVLRWARSTTESAVAT